MGEELSKAAKLAISHEAAGGDACVDHNDDGCCDACGVELSECESCDGIGYHREWCSDSDYEVDRAAGRSCADCHRLPLFCRCATGEPVVTRVTMERYDTDPWSVAIQAADWLDAIGVLYEDDGLVYCARPVPKPSLRLALALLRHHRALNFTRVARHRAEVEVAQSHGLDRGRDPGPADYVGGAGWPVGQPVILTDDQGKQWYTETESKPWRLGHGDVVVAVRGIAGGYLLSRLQPIPDGTTTSLPLYWER